MNPEIPAKRMKHSNRWDEFVALPKGQSFPVKNIKEYHALRMRCTKAKIRIKMRSVPDNDGNLIMTIFKLTNN